MRHSRIKRIKEFCGHKILEKKYIVPPKGSSLGTFTFGRSCNKETKLFYFFSIFYFLNIFDPNTFFWCDSLTLGKCWCIGFICQFFKNQELWNLVLILIPICCVILSKRFFASVYSSSKWGKFFGSTYHRGFLCT